MMWTKTEPVRAYFYGLMIPVLALLVYLGVLADGAVPLILAVAGAVLVPVAAESARAKVTPVADDPGRHAAPGV